VRAVAADRHVRSLIAIQFISMGAMEMSNPFWPLHLRVLAGDAATLALAGTGVYVLPMLGMALTSVWWGRMGDRHGHRPMMVRALLGLAATQLGLAGADSASEVMAWRLAQGALAGFVAPAQAYGAQLLGDAKPYALFAALQVATNVSSLLGATLGGALWQLMPFAGLNALAAALCLGCALMVVLGLPAQPPATSAPPVAGAGGPAVSGDVPSGVVAMALLIGVLGLLVGARMVTQMPFSLYADSVLGFSPRDIGLAYGCMALGFALAALGWVRRFEALDLRRTLLLQLGITALLVLVAWGLGQVRELGHFLVGQVLWGAAIAGSTPVLTALLARLAGPARRGRVLGWNQSVVQLLSAAGVGLGGWVVYAGGLASVYGWVAGVYALAGLGVWVLLFKLHKIKRMDE